MVIDPHKREQGYKNWKAKNKKIEGLPKKQSDLILQFLEDMENGVNVAYTSKKGGRGYARLYSLKNRLPTLFRLMLNDGIKDVTKLNERKVNAFFSKIRNGSITKEDGTAYKSAYDFIKDFKTFWHWYQKYIFETEGEKVSDVTSMLDASKGAKPEWTWIKENELKKLMNAAKYEHKVLLFLLFESGMRSPSEISNVKVGDLKFNGDFVQVHIRHSKTFARKIKLFSCRELLQEYIASKGLKEQDYLFKILPYRINEYFNRLGKRVIGKGFTMYDLRHSSAVYWLPRCKTHSVMMYRFGWKKPEMINYYSEFLGMSDTTSEEDLYIADTKTQLEREMVKMKKEMILMQDQLKAYDNILKRLPTEDIKNIRHKQV